MNSKSRQKAAMSVAREAEPTRTRANKFGWTDAEFRRRRRLWEWALQILERRSCGARRRRDGKPCKAPNEPGKTRCRWHGGLSTGPRTTTGRARALQNLRQFRAAAPTATATATATATSVTPTFGEIPK
ncbi:HGGxSTG domain-containing protein [Stenotrophomonas rhizophila]|uniref:HGGxSTG domain-containing protein n=1 Tax=Stenotrophomonas rhizophila TaxID=216778 RepID=UPI003D18C32A